MPGVTTAYQNGVHGSRPAANSGCILYACSTHSLIYRSDGTTWTTWMTIGTSTTSVATDAIWDAKGDLAGGTGADTAARLAVGANDTILMADSGETTGMKWVAAGTPSTQAFGDSAVVGTADTFTRGDHKHAMPAAPVVNTTAEVVLGADVNLSVGGTFYTALTATPAAGTYDVVGKICINPGTFTGYEFLNAQLLAGATPIDETNDITNQAGGANTLVVFATVVLDGSTAITLKGMIPDTNAGAKMLRDVATGSASTHTATKLRYTRIA